jgi:hypothetical protein
VSRFGERDVAEIDRDDEGLGERLAVGVAREDPVLGGEPDARHVVVVGEEGVDHDRVTLS